MALKRITDSYSKGTDGINTISTKTKTSATTPNVSWAKTGLLDNTPDSSTPTSGNSVQNIYQQQLDNLNASNQSKLDLINRSFDAYRSQLERNKVNSQAQLASATEKSRAMMDNYLKALGLYGSGAGQSEYANLGANYQNNLASINDSYNDNLMNAELDRDEKLLSQQDIYDEKSADLQAKQIEYNDTQFDNMMNEMIDENATVAQLRDYYNNNSSKISEDLRNAWEQRLNNKTDVETKVQKEAYKALVNTMNSITDYEDLFEGEGLNSDSQIINTINNISTAYDEGNISKEQYNTIRDDLLDKYLTNKFLDKNWNGGTADAKEVYYMLNNDMFKDIVEDREFEDPEWGYYFSIKDGELYRRKGNSYDKFDGSEWVTASSSESKNDTKKDYTISSETMKAKADKIQSNNKKTFETFKKLSSLTKKS